LTRDAQQLGSSLGIKTLAEGIEDTAELRALQRAGCELGQGFLFSRPAPAAAIEELIEEQPCQEPIADGAEAPMVA